MNKVTLCARNLKKFESKKFSGEILHPNLTFTAHSVPSVIDLPFTVA